ncbi:hypothetical protein DLAC_02853 [Tieghemostelium lacteum]|uniref:Ankyrin repeat-containing protein n=1 Tax=Tieghemostelium lacteum TaxID=361077 RepID=A0A152A3K9_TIELA|nr:hypothetical protein DLAC_02853 [Tieghemostelium lacteum]|eukprot:KYR00800.1 hypothetical protein DLAC_02853 [Tieghemostelium lacteum]
MTSIASNLSNSSNSINNNTLSSNSGINGTIANHLNGIGNGISNLNSSGGSSGGSTSKIIDAARKGNVELVQKLIKKDWKKINKKDEKGDTCLHKASCFGSADCLEVILKYASMNNYLPNQVNVNIKNNDGYTPFMYAVLNGWKECSRVLLSYGAEVNEKFPNNPGIPISYSINNGTGIYTWKIENYSKIKDRKIFSNTFLVSGFTWKLVAYPRGSKSDDNFSLYLEVANHESLGDGWSHLANFTFIISNQLDPNKKITREVTAHRFHRNHTDLGFSQILKKEMLNNKKLGWLLNDTLLIEFKIEVLQNLSYYNHDSSSMYTWKIHGVTSMRERATSPVFKVGHCKWMIALYPKGKSGANNLSVYLKVADSSVLPIDWFFLVSFRFSIIDQKHGTKFTRQVEGKKFKSNIEDWGFPQFMKLSSLYDSQSGFIKTNDDSIIIELQMEIINDYTKKKYKDNISDWGISPLHWLSYKGSYEGVRVLLTNSANPNVMDSRGRTPLDWCAYNGDLPTSEVLINVGGADLNCKDHEGFTPLHKAVMNGHLEVARLLVKYGACVNAKNSSKVSPLSLAIRVNRMWCVESLIKWGADLNLTDKQGRSPLHWAIFLGDSKLLNLLIKYGCNDSIIERKPQPNPIQPICINNISNNNSSSSSSSSSATTDEMAVSTEENDQNQLEGNDQSDLTDSDPDSDFQLKDNQIDNQDSISQSTTTTTTTTTTASIASTISTLPTINNNNNTMDQFQKSKSPLQVNIKDHDGYTPLHKAIWKGKLSFVKLLLEKGGDPSITTKDNRNSLHISVSSNEYNITQLLLDYSSQDILHHFDDSRQTPLHKAVANGNIKMLELLISRGANVNKYQIPEISPINEAIKNSDILCMIYLLQNSADIHKNPTPKSLMELLSKKIKLLKQPNNTLTNNSNITSNITANTSNNTNIQENQNSNNVTQHQQQQQQLYNNNNINGHQNIDNQIPNCTLSKDLYYLINNTSYKDVTFIVEDKEIHAWKGILCARSDYFRAMFETPLKESIESTIKIESISHSTFLLVMEYLYTGSIPETLSLDDSMSLFIASNRFMLHRLNLLCERLIVRELNVNNVYSTFKLTDIYETSFLLSESVKFLSENYYLGIPETSSILKMPSFRKSLLDFLYKSLSKSQSNQSN